MPPFSADKRDGGVRRTWVQPVGICPQYAGGAGIASLAGGLRGFSHLDVINDIDGKLSITRIPVVALIEEAAKGGADAEARATQTLARITGQRADFAGLDMASPQIMGILNATPDSFSDGGDHSAAEHALASAEQMIQDGAAILDVGGESTRPGADPVGFDEECARILPIITPLSAAGHVVSADTRHTNVMAAALDAGAGIINDVGGLRDEGAMDLVAKQKAPSIIMHMQGEPGTMQENPTYHYAPTDIYDWLEDRILLAQSAGMALSDLAIDPGFGFGKTPQHNMMIMANISLFHGLGVPIVLGVSRKSTIAHYSRGEAAKDRLAGSVALAALGLQQGVQVFRVHDVAATAQAVSNAAAFASF